MKDIEKTELEEPTPQEVADACRDVLDQDTCDAIAEEPTVDDAEQLAITALECIGIDGTSYLQTKGILES